MNYKNSVRKRERNKKKKQEIKEMKKNLKYLIKIYKDNWSIFNL